MERRTFLTMSMAMLAAPAVARAQGNRVLRFLPSADVTVLDPHWTTALVTRNHGYMVYDTLYGQDSQFRVVPQMVEGHQVDEDGRRWSLLLRPGLRWHDGEPVLARDCVASIRRWGVRDSFGQLLLEATEELSAPDDRTIRFRLKRRFPLLPSALARSSFMPAMMPERLARTDPNKQVPEIIGSGPFRYLPNERLAGARTVYERFAGYVPLSSGTPDSTAGPKVVHVDRVECTVVPDAATAASALRSNEQDWLEYPSFDLLDLLKRDPRVTVSVKDLTGLMPFMRVNHLQPPFSNAAVRRAILPAIDQSQFMQAVCGPDRTLWRDRVGYFAPGTPNATDAGIGALSGPRNADAGRRALEAAGYRGEKVAILSATDLPISKALADVAADALKQIGMNVDQQSMDWGTVVQRRAKKDPVDQGGWSAFFSLPTGTEVSTPATSSPMRATGGDSWFGWPKSERMEKLRDDWVYAEGEQAQKRIAGELQQVCFEEVPYVPLGQILQPTAHRTSLSGIVTGFPVFWNVRKEA